MSEFEFPELPSDEELGITEEDLKEYEEAGVEKGAPAAPPAEPPVTRARASAESRPRGRRGPVTLVLLLAAAWLCGSGRAVPGPVAANAPDSVFSSGRAMAILAEIARRPHPTGSPEHTRVRTYVLERLRALGLQPQLQTTTSIHRDGAFVRTATVRNIVARLRGTASTGAILLMAHYDARGQSMGAGDDGTGVVTLLETVRALTSSGPLRNDVIVLFTDAEELGLMGAHAFVDEHPWMADVALVLNVEMRGAAGPSIMFETGEKNGWIVRAFAAADPGAFANSLSYEIYKKLPNDTDFTPFKSAGKQGLNFAAIGRADVYHQRYDSPENLSERTLQHHGVQVLALARDFGGRDLSDVDAPDAVFFRIPFGGMVVYDPVWVLPVSGGLLLLLVLSFLAVRMRGGRWSGIAVGLALALAAAALAGGAGYGLMRWLPRFHPEYGALAGSAFHREAWYVLSLTAAAGALVAALFGGARRRFSTAELAMGAMIVPTAAAVVLSFMLPAAAMDLQWPAMAGILGTALQALTPTDRRSGIVVPTALLLLSLPVLAFLVPLSQLIWLALSFANAAAIGVVLALTFVLLLPQLEMLREPNGWWAAIAGVALAGAFLAIGIRTARPAPSRPAPSTLVYAWDRGSGRAVWATGAADRPGGAEARAWAEATTGATFAADTTLDAFGYVNQPVPVAPAPVVEAAPVEVAVLADTVLDGVRRARLSVRSVLGAELLLFRLGGPQEPRVVAVNGRALPSAADGAATRPATVEHWGVPEGGAVTLEVEVAPDAPLSLSIVEHLLRPGELLGEDVFRRPPSLAPNIHMMSDRAMILTRWSEQAEREAGFVS